MAFKRNILIVDDEPTVLDFLRDGLNEYSDQFEVHTATSAQEALEILDTEQIALVTTDIRMPGMDGFELIRHAREKNPDTRFIVMTAYSSDESFEKSKEYGAVDYIKKPFAVEGFVKKLLQALKPKSGFTAGKLQGFQLTDALQLVHLVRKSQTICVKTEFGEECLIYMKDGEVVHATLHGMEGEEAFYKIIALEGGEIESSVLPDDVPNTIHCPLPALILQGMRLKDELEALEIQDEEKGDFANAMEDFLETDSPEDANDSPSASTSQPTAEELLVQDFETIEVSDQDIQETEEKLGQPPPVLDGEFFRLVDDGFDQFKEGDLVAAREQWEKALELRPDDKALQFNLKKLTEKEKE